jgi:hypothetical protein
MQTLTALYRASRLPETGCTSAVSRVMNPRPHNPYAGPIDKTYRTGTSTATVTNSGQTPAALWGLLFMVPTRSALPAVVRHGSSHMVLLGSLSAIGQVLFQLLT